jgi:hypothetical protein
MPWSMPKERLTELTSDSTCEWSRCGRASSHSHTSSLSGAGLCLAVAVGATLIAFQRQILGDQLIGIGFAVLFVSAALVMIRARRWALIVGGLSAIVFLVAATQR